MECPPASVAGGCLDVRFRAARTVPARVRMLVGLRLDAWGLEVLRDDATLIASELVTNAVLHVSEVEIRARLTREARGVLLEVWDSSDVLPVPRVDDEGLGGRGLPLVAALAAKCGVHRTAPYGKWVWARIEFPGKGV